jgi:S-layer homology domain
MAPDRVRRVSVLILCAFVVGWVSVRPGLATGQPLIGGGTFGIASEVAHVVGAWEFDPQGDATSNSFVDRFCLVGGCGLLASLRLPSGAVVSRLELDACDSNSGGLISFVMWRTASPASAASLTNLTGFGTTGGQPTATPGCAIFTQPLATPVTIDNKNFNYALNVVISTNADTLSFSAVRVYYTLQVSPAPGTGTFGDVPTSHPFFQFVEALVASGITAGCGGGNYCPDDPLTRGQMAVFLSKALGLHFAP